VNFDSYFFTLTSMMRGRLFRLLADPDNMDRQAFLNLIAHEKLSLLYSGAP
jgi:hypothetical protein